MAHLSRRQKFAASATALVLVGSGTAAFAYWSTTGSGSGTASTTAGAPSLVITQTSAPTNMAPGVAAGGISATVQNTAVNTAYVTKLVVSIASVSGGDGACSAADYTLTGATMTNGAGDLAAGSTATFSGATLGFNNTADNQDGCKHATVNLAYAAS